jgi:hypothetical protein
MQPILILQEEAPASPEQSGAPHGEAQQPSRILPLKESKS